MQQPLNFYLSLVYFATAVPYAWLGLIAWRRRPAVAVAPFSWAMLGMSIWTLGYALELLAPNLLLKLLVVKFEYIGIVTVPVFLLIFSLEFTGRRHYLPKRLQPLLWLFPSFFLFIAWTNEFHRLMWGGENIIQAAGIHLLKIEYHLFFWLHIAFSYLLILGGNLLLFRELVKSTQTYRLQIGLVVIGLISPLAGNLIFISNSGDINGLDPTPLFFIPTAFGLYWVTMRYRLLKVMPLEHLAILENMMDGVIVVDVLKRVLYINPVIENLFGRSESEAIGQPLYRLSDQYGDELASHLTAGMKQAELNLGEGEQARVFEATISSASSLKAPAIPLGPDQMITLHDITHRKGAERILRRRELMMSAISLAATEFLQESATWEHTVPGVLEKIGEAADVSHIYVFINYSDDTNLLFTSLCYEWASIDTKSHLNNPSLRHIPVHEGGLERWEKEFLEGSHILGQVSDLPTSEKVIFADMESLSVLAFPIMVENQWWGFIMFDECKFNRYWTDVEIKALNTMATIFGSAETRARTQQKLIRRQNALSFLHEIVRTALQAHDLNIMAQEIVDSIGMLINANGCFITLWDDLNKITRPLAAYGTKREEYLNLNLEPGKLTFTESVVRLGHTLVVEDVRHSRYADKTLAERFPSHSMLVIPLATAGKKMGAILISFDHHHRFQPEEISICEQAVSLIALAFEKFLAMEQAEHRATRSETLVKAGTLIAETLETDQAIPRILEQLKQVVAYDSASVQLLDGNELVIVGGSGFSDLKTVVGMRFPIPGDNPNSVVIQTEKPYAMGNVQDVYADFRKPSSKHIYSWLGVPLIVQGRIIGLLSMDSNKLNDFTQEDMNLAALFANQVAVALENVRVFKESQNQAITDALTGLYNRRGLFELGQIGFDKAALSDRPFSAIMIDIDHFKQINDTYGHEVGDKVLQSLAKRCKKCIRDIDIIGRYGGEEIVIILPETDLNLAAIIANRVLDAIASKPLTLSQDYELDVTASLGVASRDANTPTLDVLLNRADQAMYVAKHNGRNRVSFSK